MHKNKKFIEFSEKINISNIKNVLLSINNFFKTEINKEIFIPNFFYVEVDLKNEDDHYFKKFATEKVSFKEIERKINDLDKHLISFVPKSLLKNTIFISNKSLVFSLYKNKYTDRIKIDEVYFSTTKEDKDIFLMFLEKSIKNNMKNKPRLSVEVSLDFFGEINNPKYYFEYFFTLYIRYSNDFQIL